MSSAQQRSAVPLDQQSVLPTVRGVPWWGAVLVATVIAGIGAAIDASNTDGLGAVFKFCYLVGCVSAALAVRRRALFTAAAQPPLIAFLVGVITLYGLNAEQASSGLKSLIFQVLLPIANDFPWMALTFLVTLGLVVARWYLTRDRAAGDKKRPSGPARPAAANGAKRSSTRTAGQRRSSARAAKDTAPSQSGTSKSAASKSAASKPGAPESSRPAPGTSNTTQSRAAQSRASRPGTPPEGADRSQRSAAAKASRSAKPSLRPDDPTRDSVSRPDATARTEQSRVSATGPTRNGHARNGAVPNGRRSTAGAVFRAGAGEQIDAVDEVVAPVAAPAPATTATAGEVAARGRVRPAADEYPRYESATGRASTAQYRSTRARNRG
ncbi:DUF6542 domain-containing protein [Gordonia sp. NPDC062954]|uniref:DUF6542 domain-containing protein n=1 Tax=Gordonia sp. NPDC062954 TaxID=3364003 RepID=UPI0037C9C58C